jgi:hypothetical protein
MFFWGCPLMSFKDSLPFHGIRQGFAASERDPNGPYRAVLKSQIDTSFHRVPSDS